MASSPRSFAGGDHDLVGECAGSPVRSSPARVQRLHVLAARGSTGSAPAGAGRALRCSVVGELLQLIAPRDRVSQALLPVRFRFQQHRQLDHIRCLQLRRAHAMQHVAGHFSVSVAVSSITPLGLKRSNVAKLDLGARVVRLVDDRNGRRKRSTFASEYGVGAVPVPQQVRAAPMRGYRSAASMRHWTGKPQSVGLVAAERLHGGHDHHRRCVQRRAGDRFSFVEVRSP